MKLEILGAESLGVRGLCCRVQVSERVIVIDPGAALAHKVSRASSVCTNAPAAIPPRKCAGCR